MLSLGRAIDLVKGFKEALLFIEGDTRPVVDDAELDLALCAFGFLVDDAIDLAVFGEFTSVREQIEQDLFEFVAICTEGLHFADVVELERVVVVLCKDCNSGFDLVKERLKREIAEVESKFSGLDAGEIEDVVDQGEELGSCALDLEEIFLGGGFGFGEFFEQEFAVADDGVEWCAQFVAHVGEKDTFGAVGFLGAISFNREFFVGSIGFSNACA